MWETLSKIATSTNLYQILIFILLLIWSLSLLAKAGILYFHNGFLSIGDGERERELIRRQQEWAYNYIMSLEKEVAKTGDYDHYFCLTILERVYDKVVEMIVFNHISERSEYVETKKSLIKSLVYSYPVKDIFKTDEFEKQIDEWVEYAIHNFIVIRSLWGKEFRK